MIVVSDEDALAMLQSANSVRDFGFIAECKGMANMHRQGTSTEVIAKTVGLTVPVAQHFIGIGYFPEDLLDMMAAATTDPVVGRPGGISWGHRTIREFLPLRQLRPGAENPQQTGILEGAYYATGG